MTAGPTMLVTGATGKTGSATALQLLQKGQRVRAFVHRRDGRSERLERLGAEVVLGSLEDFEDLLGAMAGAHRAYFCPPLGPGMLRKAALFAAAAEEAKLEVVVALSQWLIDPTHRALHSREKWLAGRLFERLRGTDVVTLTPGFFADNYMAALEPVAQFGLLAMPLGQGLNAPPSNEDIGRVTAAILVDPRPHLGKSYRPTGPRLLSPEEIARSFGRVLGRPVRYQDAPLPLFLKVARQLGVSDYTLAQLYWFLQDYQRNSFAVGAPTEVVQEVGGSPPEEFELIARRYAAAFPAAKRTLGAQLRAATRLLSALLARTPDVSAISERLELPTIGHASLAADSSRWRRTHAPRLSARGPQSLVEVLGSQGTAP